MKAYKGENKMGLSSLWEKLLNSKNYTKTQTQEHINPEAPAGIRAHVHWGRILMSLDTDTAINNAALSSALLRCSLMFQGWPCFLEAFYAQGKISYDVLRELYCE